MQYPSDFLNQMKTLLKSDYEEFEKALNDTGKSGIRVNESKISVDDFIKIAPYTITRIPFVSNGFYINENDKWSKHPYYYAGLYYIQEPSAMLPADRLPICSQDAVLDLCAAPGGKSTMLSTRDIKLLVSNDISFSRTIPLVKNLEIFGSCRSFVISEDPQNLEKIFPEFFDKILVDAPCSGEGMFRKDDGLIKSYVDRGPDYYADIQKSVLKSAVRMLKDGGMLMYSTCTFSNLEDEEVILDIIEEFPEIHTVSISQYEGFSGPYSKYSDNPEIENVVHVLPHKTEGEGHFLCLLKKVKETANDIDSIYHPNSCSASKNIVCYDKLPESVKDFLNNYNDKERFLQSSYMLNKDGNIYILPEGYETILSCKLRFLRTGVLIGSINSKNGKFIPGTAMALANEFGKFNNVLDLKCDDNIVIKYLKGETLVIDNNSIKEPKAGFVQIKVDGFPLGFAKYDNSKYKNLYEKGWVMK